MLDGLGQVDTDSVIVMVFPAPGTVVVCPARVMILGGAVVVTPGKVCVTVKVVDIPG